MLGQMIVKCVVLKRRNNMKNTDKELYEMKLHEEIIVKTSANDNSFIKYRVTRVPGGWIYRQMAEIDEAVSLSIAFVPYSDEFHPMNTKRNNFF